jgi:hypothetical protein
MLSMSRVTKGPVDQSGSGQAATSTGAASDSDAHLLSAPPMRYQSEYVWIIFFSSMDIMLTWAILRRGGEEVNPMARLVIEWWGLNGAIAFKFALMLFVIVSCEIVGRRRDLTGRRLARVAVIIAASPVVYSLGLLVDHVLLRPSS